MESVNFREFRKNLAGCLVPPAQVERKPRQLGTMQGQIWMAEDFDETPADIVAIMRGEDE